MASPPPEFELTPGLDDDLTRVGRRISAAWRERLSPRAEWARALRGPAGALLTRLLELTSRDAGAAA